MASVWARPALPPGLCPLQPLPLATDQGTGTPSSLLGLGSTSFLSGQFTSVPGAQLCWWPLFGHLSSPVRVVRSQTAGLAAGPGGQAAFLGWNGWIQAQEAVLEDWCSQNRGAPPRHGHGDLTSLAPHERLPEILVVPREKTPTIFPFSQGIF